MPYLINKEIKLKSIAKYVTKVQHSQVQGQAERFGKTVLSGTVGMGNFSLSALLAGLKAFQLLWSAGLYSNGLLLWRRISKTTNLSL
jgi:hypothetical protein